MGDRQQNMGVEELEAQITAQGEKEAAAPAAPKAKKEKKPKEPKQPQQEAPAAPPAGEDDMQAQLDAAIAQQVALGATIKQKKEDKEEFADLVLQLKKVKQQVNALSKQLNPAEDNFLESQ